MKIFTKNPKKGLIKLMPENLEDLWVLGNIIEPGDLVKGKTERKIKIGQGENTKVDRKVFFLEIKTEKTEFNKNSNILRISGLVESEIEDIPKHSHHTISVPEFTELAITKPEGWKRYQLERIEENTKTKNPYLIVLFDRENSLFALLKNTEYKVIRELKGNVAQKRFQEKGENFYKKIAKEIEELDSKYSFRNIILASPAFWKEYLIKEMPEKTKKKSVQVSCSDITRQAIGEIIKSEEVKNILKEGRARKEAIEIENLMKEISNDGAVYGIDDVEAKINEGNCRKLLISQNFFLESREKGFYERLDRMIKNAESLNSEIFFIESEVSKRIDGLGGVCAVLRWKQ